MKISGQIVDIHNRCVFGGVVSIVDGKIASIRRSEETSERYILPGFIDSHVHIESSMVSPAQFAVTAVRHGTVAVVSDPHEIANVLGVEGVRFMINDAGKVPLKFVFGAPSCVPATQFETSGAIIDSVETDKLLSDPSVGYLAEMMNFPGVLYGDPEVMAKINSAKKYGKKIDGHAPGLTGEDLLKYVGAGISTDHECSSLEEALEKIELGMKILIREGSAAKNLEALKSLIETNPQDVMLCSDDLHPEMLEKGHINILAARLINDGFDIFNVIRAVTLNPVLHYGIDMGLLRTGDNADFIVVDDLKTMHVLQTWINGECVYNYGETMFDAGEIKVSNTFNASLVTLNDILLRNSGLKIQVIKAYNGELITDKIVMLSGNDKYIESSTENDVLKIVVKQRYNDGIPAVALINGMGIKEGAFATSVAHDSHNIIAVGSNDKDIVDAINMVIDAKGGMSVVTVKRRELLRLPIAGIMSDLPVETVAERYQILSEMVKGLGCKMDAPFMTLSFMALLVIPCLKIGDKGLFDVIKFAPTSLFVD
jgi:adenine deaminase